MTAHYTTDLNRCGCLDLLACECNSYVVSDSNGTALSTHRFMADADKLRDKLNEIAAYEEAESTRQTLRAYEQLAERERFEQACYAHYLERHAAGKTEDCDCTPNDREQLMWRTMSGEYGVLMFNAAWWAWQEALR